MTGTGDEDLRVAVYRGFATSGAAPALAELARGSGQPVASVRAGLRRLAVDRHLVLDTVLHTRGHQRLFCRPACVDAWLASTGNTVGYVMDLSTLWRLAAHWYDGRLEASYTRRDPSTAARYFRDVGLTGPFWGL